MVADLRALIVEKLGTHSRPEAQAALRELYQNNPAERDAIARALAAHPAEESLPILVARSIRAIRTRPAWSSAAWGGSRRTLPAPRPWPNCFAWPAGAGRA